MCWIFNAGVEVLHIGGEVITLGYKNINAFLFTKVEAKWPYERESETDTEWEGDRLGQEQQWLAPDWDTYIQSLASSCFFRERFDRRSPSEPAECCLLLVPKTTWRRHSADCFPWLNPGVENFRHNTFFCQRYIFLPVPFTWLPQTM